MKIDAGNPLNCQNLSSFAKRTPHLIAILLGIFFAFASGCRTNTGDLTIWKSELRSPDGLWIASARTIQNGGFGSADIETIVSLRQSRVSQPSVDVLVFACQGPAAAPYELSNANAGGTIDLTMKWLSPRHLHVTYDKHPDLLFQAIKAFGTITISAQDLPREPGNGKDSQ
jgi:hypothetical protein